MHEIAYLQWLWKMQSPLVSGYSPNLAQATGLIDKGASKVANLRTRDSNQQLEPSFLATSVKGVFRSAAAWMIERTGRIQGNGTYVTCDYGLKVSEEHRFIPNQHKFLCPVCQVFGSSGCLSDDEGSPIQRRQGRLRFNFITSDDTAREDAWHGTAKFTPQFRFAWQSIALKNRPYLSNLKQFLETLINAARNTRDLSINSQQLFQKANDHPVFVRLRTRSTNEQITDLSHWLTILVEDFPFAEMDTLAQSLQEAAGISNNPRKKHNLYLNALKKTKKEITKILSRTSPQKLKGLSVEQLELQKETLTLEAQITDPDDFALALLWLAGDLISSGFFRFGRFTSRGYGVVRLTPTAYARQDLATLLAADTAPDKTPLDNLTSGYAAAQTHLDHDPQAIITQTVQHWLTP